MSNQGHNRFLDVQKYIMIFVGKWYIGFENITKNRIYSMYSIFVETYFVLLTQHIFISMIIYRKCPERMVELVCYYIQYTNSNICSLLSKRNSFRKIFNYIIDHEAAHIKQATTAHVYLKYAKLNKKVIVLFLALTGVAGGIWYILVVKDTFSAEENGYCSVKKGLNFQIWYPFDLYNKCYVVTLLIDTLMYITVVCIHIFNKISPVSFMIYILGQIKILHEMIKHIETDAASIYDLEGTSYEKAILRNINKCVKMHQEVIGFMGLIETGCKEIVTIGFFTNSLELAAFVIKLLLEENVFGALRTIGILCMTITQLFLFFWFANEIKVESTHISDVIYYETNWLNYDVYARKHLWVMMIRSQRPLTIDVAGIGDMSIETFKRLSDNLNIVSAFTKSHSKAISTAVSNVNIDNSNDRNLNII